MFIPDLTQYYLVKKVDCDIIKTEKGGIVTQEAKLKTGKSIWKEAIDNAKVVEEIDQKQAELLAEIERLEQQKQLLTK